MGKREALVSISHPVAFLTGVCTIDLLISLYRMILWIVIDNIMEEGFIQHYQILHLGLPAELEPNM